MFPKRKIFDIAVLVCYVALIYSTLGITPGLYKAVTKFFGPHINLFINTAVAILLAATLLLFWKHFVRKKFYVYAGIIALLSVYALYLARLTIIVEKVHLVEYGFLACLIYRVFRPVRPRPIKYLYMFTTLTLIGYCDELIQKFLPNRVYDLRDVVLNVASGLLAFGLIKLLR